MRWVCMDRICLCALLAVTANAAPDNNDPTPGNAAAISPAGFEQEFLNSVAKGPGLAPRFWRPYLQQTLPHPVLLNSPRLGNLIQNGKLELSLADALALTVENNLDIVVQRYVVPYAETDILRTKSGQAARGFGGALYPSELNSGAIGAGVSNAGGTGGTGNAGGITGGGGAVAVGPAGAFDPTVNFLYSWDRVVSPLNSLVVSGIPTTTSYATAFSASYAQMFTTGASYSVSLSTLRQSTTQRNTLYNPDVTSRLSIGFNQPLLAGFGRLANERFIMVARNNQGTAQEVFREQVIASVAQLVAAYYDLVSFQSNVRVAQESLAAVTELVTETRRQEEIGMMARLDVVTAESQLAASRRDLIVAETNLQQQETTLKQLLSKRDEPELDSAAVVVTDPLPEPREADIPNLSAALETAVANRPELRQARNNLANQNTAIAYARNNLLPNTSVFGLYAGAGLQGNTAAQTGGAAGSLGQTFSAVYPESAFGVSFAASIRNRSAQADNVRSQLERNQLEIGLQNTRNQVNLQVQQARVGLVQGQAQVQAAHEAVRLALESRDAERAKLRAGISTPYNVVLKERDLVSAQYAEVQVESAYAKAVIAMDQATGTTLERNGIRLDDALSGTVSQRPTPDLNLPLIPERGGER